MNREFKEHPLNKNGIEKNNLIEIEFDALLNILSNYCPIGREFSIVKTKLEEACFFAKKAIASHPDNQDWSDKR